MPKLQFFKMLKEWEGKFICLDCVKEKQLRATNPNSNFIGTCYFCEKVKPVVVLKEYYVEEAE